MKTKEELNALKEEVETVSKKLHELTDEELAQVSGGSTSGIAKISQASPKESGSAVTTEDRYTALAGL